MTMPDWKNQLYLGDNLNILRNHVAHASVDLSISTAVQLQRQLQRPVPGTQRRAVGGRITAFEDTWQRSLESESAYQGVAANAAGAQSALV